MKCKVKRCAGEKCNRIIRKQNKSGFCQDCYIKNWKEIKKEVKCMIKKDERDRMANIIFLDIVDRIQEFGIKAERKNLNDAYFLAFQIGIESDISDSLKKLKEKMSTKNKSSKL